MIDNYLENAADSHRLSHAYIIEGASADIRKKAAGDFIGILMGDEQHVQAQISAGTHPDIIWVTHEKPMTISVREVREQICDTISVRPFEGGRKVYVMDDAQLMPPGAQNALLKTLEEPPEYAVILLMTDNQATLLDTIRSRCIVLKCDNVTDAEESDKADLLEGFTFDISQKRNHCGAARANEITAEVLSDGPKGAQQFLDLMRKHIKELMVLHNTSEAFDTTRAVRALELIDEAETRLKFNVNSELTIEMMLMEI
ncbi:MAG: hypothetical protein Q4E54_03045 [Lachnospiraceae bacterium]|nr:hypothetical protein [Lachnospiraceae bacterium]